MSDKLDRAQELADELENFQEIARHLNPGPGERPRIPGIEIDGFTIPLHEGIGGDHTIYVDFDARYDLDGRIAVAREAGREEIAEKLESCKSRAGILLADVAGHRMTDAAVAAMLHQAFLLGVRYELELYGEVTTHLFENINTRFFRTTAVNKYFTMIYGEILTDGTFRFVSAGHQAPAVFSQEYGEIFSIRPDRVVSFPPVGMLPTGGDLEEQLGGKLDRFKKRYEVNELRVLAAGDIMLLFTDGFTDHADGCYYPDQVEQFLAENRSDPLKVLCGKLRENVLARATPKDDISVVMVRRTG